MRLALKAKEGVKITAKMLGYYAEKAAIASFDNSKIWDNFKTCILDSAQHMDSKDSLRVLKGISKISEKFTPDHYIDLLTVTYNKIESNILNMSTTDLAFIAETAAKVGIIDNSLSQAITVSFISRLAQSTPSEIVILVKSLKSLSIETEFYDEIINHIHKTHSIFPIKDIIAILFLCIDSNMIDLLNDINTKISSSISKLSDEDIVKTLYLYSNNGLQIPITTNIKLENISDNLIPHLLFSMAVNKIDIRDYKDLYIIENKVTHSLNNFDSISKLIILMSLSLNIINSGSNKFTGFFKNNHNHLYQIFTEIYNNYEDCNDTNILTYLLECIALFANIYHNNDLCTLFNTIIKKLDTNKQNNEVIEWIKTIVPYVWLDSHEIGNYFDDTNKNVEKLQNLPMKNLNILHDIATNHVIFHKEYPFNISNIDRFNPPLILPDIKLTLQKIGEIETLQFKNCELLIMNNICFVPLYPIHYINGTNGYNPEIELPNAIIRQNVRNSLIDLSKKYKIAPIPYWKWRRILNDDERTEYLNKIIKNDLIIK